MRTVPRRVSSTRFIGRIDQLAVFDDVLAGAREGRGDVVLVSGEAGVGKSRFVNELAHRSTAAGVEVLTGWCVEHGEQILPLAPIIDVLRAGALALASGDPNAAVGSDTDGLTILDRAGDIPLSVPGLLDGTAGCLRALSARKPVVVLIEDLHWADESTLQVLSFLAPRMAGNPVVLVLTFRADELHRRHPLRPFLLALQRAVRPEQIELAPFSMTEMMDLVQGLTDRAQDAHFMRALHTRSGGNAFYVEELLTEGQSVSFPQILRDAILSRTDGLDAPTSAVLRAAAAAGIRIDPQVLAVACALEPAHVHRLLEAIDATGLTVRDHAGVRFRHELARETIEAELLPGDRASVHAALAAALVALTPERIGEIARHWMLAGHQAQALVSSVAAGRKAVLISADAEALLQFERALELWDRVSDAASLAGVSRSAVLLDAADAAGRARRFATAMRLGRRALVELDGGDPIDIGMGSLRLTEWAWFAADDSEIRTLVQSAIDLLPAEQHGGAHALAVAWQALLLTEGGGGRSVSFAPARARASEALWMARACAADRAEVHALLTIGVCTCLAGDPAGVEELRAGLELAVSRGCVQEVGRGYNSLAKWLAHFDQHDAVIDLSAEAGEHCANAGMTRVYGPMIELGIIRSLCRLGRWPDVEARVSALAGEFDGLQLEHFTLADSWGLVLVRQGRPEGVAALLAETFGLLSGHDSLIGPVTVTAVELAAAENRFGDIPGLVEVALERILPRFHDDAAAVLASAIGALADDTGSAAGPGTDSRSADVLRAAGWLRLVEQACSSSSGAPVPTAVAHLTTARAELARLGGEQSADAWRMALSEWHNIEAPYEVAHAHWRYADSLLRGESRQSVGTRSSATASLIAARRIAADLGAKPLRDHIDNLARLAHISIPLPEDTLSSAAEAVASADRHGLTKREFEVLRLVADGFTNGEIGQSLFISRKTAGVHVSNILRKLGVTNRVEAAIVLTTLSATARRPPDDGNDATPAGVGATPSRREPRPPTYRAQINSRAPSASACRTPPD